MNNDRLMGIVNMVSLHGEVSIGELSDMFYVSASTIRRDLKQLELDGYLRRTHGGAMQLQMNKESMPFDFRMQTFSQVKRAIAKKAADEIQNGDCIFLDASSTVSGMISYLNKYTNLIIVTNSLYAAMELEQMQKFTVYSTGGLLQTNTRSFVGASALEMVQQFAFDKMFFSPEGICLDKHAVYDSGINHVELWKQVLKLTKKNYLLAHAQKFQRTPCYKVCSLDMVDYLVTDVEIAETDMDSGKVILCRDVPNFRRPME